MPTSYPGTPTDRTEITVPAGSDKPSGALISTPLEQTWDQVLALKSRAQIIESPLAHSSFAFSLVDNPRASGDYLFLGAALGPEAGDAGDTWGAEVGDTPITGLIGTCLRLNGSAAGGGRGTWRISGHLYVTIDNTADPSNAIIDLRSSPTVNFPADSTLVDQYVEFRFSATSGSYIRVPFSTEFYHDSADDLYLALRVAPGSNDLAVVFAGRVSVTQISRVLPP